MISRRLLTLTLGGAIFLAAALLFLVQPMVAKMILPLFGGSPAVWNVSLVFFQGVLLLGYLLAHGLARLRSRAAAAVLWSGLMAAGIGGLAARFPVPADAVPAGGAEAVALLSLLAVTLGLPVLALGAVGPLLQSWFSRTTHRRAPDPYFFYGVSNAGSLVGLIAYPAAIEPGLGLGRQAAMWTFGCIGLLAAVLASAAFTGRWRRPQAEAGSPGASDGPRPSPGRRLLWIALAAMPSSLMLGVTAHVSTAVAAMPLLWVGPLALYLVAYVLAFSPRVQVRPGTLAAIVGVGTILIASASPLKLRHPAALFIGLHLATFFFAAWACHARLAALRPAASRLTGFYLCLAVGGAVGGAGTALAAPLVFARPIEYPLALVCAILLIAGPAGRAPARDSAPAPIGLGRFLVPAGGVLAAILLLSSLFAPDPTRGPLLASARTFFGVHQVHESIDAGRHVLYHGMTMHGMQFQKPESRGQALGYFHAEGPIGDVFRIVGAGPGLERCAVVGLGAGSLAAYGRPGRRFAFFEIDPEVARIATTASLFSFVADSPSHPDLRIVLGDGRIKLRGEPDQSFDLVVIDAFTSDAVPTHLITREAIAVYLDKLAPGGLLAFHISNNFFDFRPVLAAIAADRGLSGHARLDLVDAATEDATGRTTSLWAVLARRLEDLQGLDRQPGWQALTAGPSDPLWTDDWSYLLGALDR